MSNLLEQLKKHFEETPKEVLENAPRHSGNYIAVPVVITGGEGA